MINKIGYVIAAKLRDTQKTQEWLADQVGVSINAVSKWTKEGKISRANAVKVAGALDISINALLGGMEAAPSEPQSMDLVYVSREESRLLTRYRECTSDGRKQLMLAADSMPKSVS